MVVARKRIALKIGLREPRERLEDRLRLFLVDPLTSCFVLASVGQTAGVVKIRPVLQVRRHVG